MFAIMGFACWAFGVLIWAGGSSAIHEILAAIIILNGTVLIAASQITSYLVGLLAEIRDKLKTTRIHREDEAKMRLTVPPPEYSNTRMKIPEAVMPVFKD